VDHFGRSTIRRQHAAVLGDRGENSKRWFVEHLHSVLQDRDHRVMTCGGIGVLKVENASYGTVRVQEAGGDAAIRVPPLSDFIVQMRDAFSVEDGLLDQPYQVRLTDGMIRCYVSGQSVAGFGHQMVRALAPPEAGPAGRRLYSGPTIPRTEGHS
jgi:hypothetical protein